MGLQFDVPKGVCQRTSAIHPGSRWVVEWAAAEGVLTAMCVYYPLDKILVSEHNSWDVGLCRKRPCFWAEAVEAEALSVVRAWMAREAATKKTFCWKWPYISLCLGNNEPYTSRCLWNCRASRVCGRGVWASWVGCVSNVRWYDFLVGKCRDFSTRVVIMCLQV